jgi:hypothetical protein
VRRHNEEAIEEIEKIKMRMGGKCYASTESLMKALVVSIPEEGEAWQGRDLNYGLISNGVKPRRLKKRGRKLNKPKASRS